MVEQKPSFSQHNDNEANGLDDPSSDDEPAKISQSKKLRSYGYFLSSIWSSLACNVPTMARKFASLHGLMSSLFLSDSSKPDSAHVVTTFAFFLPASFLIRPFI